MFAKKPQKLTSVSSEVCDGNNNNRNSNHNSNHNSRPAPSQTSLYESTYWNDVVKADEALRATRNAMASLDEDSDVVSPLTGRRMPVETFKTEHMVPFYGGSVKQPSVEHSQTAYGSKLDAFTGTPEFQPWGRKSDATALPLFRPHSQGPMTSGGRPAVDLDDERAQFLATMPKSRIMNNVVAPGMEPQLVARPGVVGGQYSDTRELTLQRGIAPTVDQLRAGQQPKETFEGRVLPGTSGTSARPDLPAVAPIRYGGGVPTRELKSMDDLLRGPGAVTGAVLRPNDYRNVRSTQRENTSTEHFGPAAEAASAKKPTLPDTGVGRREPMPMLPELPAGHAASTSIGRGSKHDHGRSAVLVYGNNRDLTTVNAHTGNFVGAFKALIAPVADALRTTIKETYDVDAPRAFGNVSSVGGAKQPMLTVYDAQDVARTTLKDTLVQEAPLGNLRGHAKVATRDPGASARPTFREGLSEASDPNRNLSTSREVGPARTDEPLPTTQRQINEATRGTAYGAAVEPVHASGHLVAHLGTHAQDTQRQDTTRDYFGQGQGLDAPMSEDAARQMRHSECREKTLVGRAPTDQGVKVMASAKEYGRGTSLGPNLASTDGASIDFFSPAASAPSPQQVGLDGTLRVGMGFGRDDAQQFLGGFDRLNDEMNAASSQRVNNPLVI